MIPERPRNKPSSSHIERPISYNKVRTTSWGTMVERFWKRCTRRLALPATWTERLAGTFAARMLKKERSISLFIIYGRQMAYVARQYSRRDSVYATYCRDIWQWIFRTSGILKRFLVTRYPRDDKARI